MNETHESVAGGRERKFYQGAWIFYQARKVKSVCFQ